MTARLPSDTPKTRLTLSAGEEVPWRDTRTDALDQRRSDILNGAQPWGAPDARRYAQAHPRRIDWWRVLALLIVAGAAVMTLVGLYLILVYVLTAF